MYHPASLIKLPILITYLKMEEKNPGILNKKLVFTLPKGGVPQQTYNTHQIEPGKSGVLLFGTKVQIVLL